MQNVRQWERKFAFSLSYILHLEDLNAICTIRWTQICVELRNLRIYAFNCDIFSFGITVFHDWFKTTRTTHFIVLSNGSLCTLLILKEYFLRKWSSENVPWNLFNQQKNLVSVIPFWFTFITFKEIVIQSIQFEKKDNFLERVVLMVLSREEMTSQLKWKRC